MKKIIASALGLMLGGTLLATTAHAELENQFGGYWRTRFSYFDNLSSYPGESKFTVNTRTRLYYTAKFSDNLKFVNKFEFDAVYGDDGYGDIGTDGKVFEIKNSYIDAKFGALQIKMGAQGLGVHRGFFFDDDFIGIVANGDFGAVAVTAFWARDEDMSFSDNDTDRDVFHAGAKIKAGDMVSIYPSVTALVSSAETVAVEQEVVVGIGQPLETMQTDVTQVGDENLIWVGLDVDVKLDPVKLWGTFVYETGDIAGVDKNAFAVGAGADAGFVHGEAYYATGDDGSDPAETTDFSAISEWHTTAEIMGSGMFDNGRSAGGPGPSISNILLGNVGTTLKPAENLTLKVDGWYGALAEENAMGNTELGYELDLYLGVRLLEKLRAEFVLAYLIAGDATNDANGNDDDCIEGGMRLSLSF